MRTITTLEAKTHLSRYLAAVESGEQIIIARGRKPVAQLVPLTDARTVARPKVGQMAGPGFEVPDEAVGPLKPQDLEDWGL